MPLHVSRIHAICFDVDGTLSDTDDVMVAQLAELLYPFSFLFPGKDLIKMARGIVMETEGTANFLVGFTDRIGLDDEIFALKDWLVRQSKKKVKPFQIIPGAKEMLEELGQRYPLAVVSARDTTSTMDFLNQFDLVSYFKVIVTDQTCAHTKPFPDPDLVGGPKDGRSPAGLPDGRRYHRRYSRRQGCRHSNHRRAMRLWGRAGTASPGRGYDPGDNARVGPGSGGLGTTAVKFSSEIIKRFSPSCVYEGINRSRLINAGF